MSQNEEIDLSQYRSSQGVETKTADVSGDGHAIAEQFGDDVGQKEFEFDATIIAERIADFYDDAGASIREYLSNAETACIRRARMELQNIGIEPPNEVREMLDLAAEKCDYEPIVEVEYRRKSDEPRLTISDNGCGITPEEYQVLRNIGYSASHADGDRLGQFGMGVLSFAKLTGTQGAIKFSTRSFETDSRPETSYNILMYVTNLEYLSGGRDNYGTTFEFPAFSESAKQTLDVPEKVDEFAEGMRVPVLYRDFDSSGNETSMSDDYLPRVIESDYADDSLVLTYEDEFFKAVMSPDYAENRRDVVTYNVSMPIRRNTSRYGSGSKFDARWQWDFRGKREDGPIVDCESDPSLVGMSPVENAKYDQMNDRQRERHVRMSDVPDDAVVMPSPSSSRDSYMGNHDQFWQHVSECVQDQFRQHTADILRTIDSWSDFRSLSEDRTRLLYRGYSVFGPAYAENDPDNIQEHLKDELGVTLDTDLCKRIDKAEEQLMVVPRGHNHPHHKKPAKRNKKKVWQILDDADDGVYMGISVSEKKANIAWGLGDTHVVRLDPDDKSNKERYSELEDLWGFKKLKDLPSSNLKEKLPNLDDDVADVWENKSANRGGGGGGVSRSNLDPDAKEITVRYKKRRRRSQSDYTVENLRKKLEADEPFKISWAEFDKLIIYDQTELSGTTVPPTSGADKRNGIAVTAVPNYVYKHLKGTKNVYTDPDSIKEDIKQDELDEYDEGDAILVCSDKMLDVFDTADDMVSFINRETDYHLPTTNTEYTRLSGDDVDGLRQASADDFDADTYSVNDVGRRWAEDRIYGIDLAAIKFDKEVPYMDLHAPEFKQVFGTGDTANLRPDSRRVKRGIEIVKACGGTWPSQQDDT